MQTIIERARDRMVIFPFVFGVLPAVHRVLTHCRLRAISIPDSELRRQAEESIRTKRFHCQGGSIYSLYVKEQAPRMISFIVALQTISDYLDNLSDRVTGTEETGLRGLHGAMMAAVDPGAPLSLWYEHYPHQDDGGYLDYLVGASQRVTAFLPGYKDVREDISQLVSLYCDLQVYKHLDVSVREERLVRWARRHSDLAPQAEWWEFAAASGSTLGVFALAATASAGRVSVSEVDGLLECYFPWICGLHILLDYFIDLDEDREHGDFNFISCYPSLEAAEEGMLRFLTEALKRVDKLSRPAFHSIVVKGLLALYLSDPKALRPERKKTAQRLLRCGGAEAAWLHRVCLGLRKKGVI